MFLVLKMGKTMDELENNYGGFEDWVIRFMGTFRQNVRVADVQNYAELPAPELFAGIIATGAHEMVTDRHGWSLKAGEYLKDAVAKNIPVLGICYGHQLLAEALGGEAGNHPKGPEIGTVDIELTEEAKNDPIFKSLPKTFCAHTTHTQSALKLPEGAVLLAKGDYEPIHAFRFGSAWGVQFHPEFDAFVMREYAELQKNKVKDYGYTMEGICETPEANSLLALFTSYCADNSAED
jgi:GMP synthase (glutamine-hydrolysing)